MPDSLKNFCDMTQESIVQWFENVKTNCSVSEMEEVDDYYIDPMLLIVEWDDNGLIQRNINKNNITTAIRSFRGVRPISDLFSNLGGGVIVANPSDSIFCVFDAPPIENQQITQDLIGYLRQTYYQANQPALGRVFDIKATVKGKFEIREHHQVF
ncbi:15366_t:CDS:2 [Gigaspora margarita]|uniref:15366_t:CDS:1 n=1 Tax=Gigaspora margarita TaxID=4874 RepID=A0ABN7UFJ2_GIGMA|nr:15366_t:CDS:2 [Gigaspora margarita]